MGGTQHGPSIVEWRWRFLIFSICNEDISSIIWERMMNRVHGRTVWKSECHCLGLGHLRITICWSWSPVALLVRKIDGFYNDALKNQQDESTQGERTPYGYRHLCWKRTGSWAYLDVFLLINMISYSMLEDWTEPHKIDHNGYGHHYQNHLSVTIQRPWSSSCYLLAWKKMYSDWESENERGVMFILTISAEG